MSALTKLGDWLGLATRSEDPEAPKTPQPPRRSTTIAEPLSLSGVYRAVAVLSTGVMQLTLDVWRGETPLAATEIPAWVRRPDIKTHRSAWLEEITTSLALTGNAYLLIGPKDSNNHPLYVEVLNPHECHPISDTELGWRGRRLGPDDYRHLKLMRIKGRATGLGPIQAARQDLHQAATTRDYAAAWFDRGDVPNGVLTTDQPITAAQAKESKDRWYDTADPAKPLRVLGQGLKYEPILLSPADAQWLESQKFSTAQIARLFGIPAHMLLAAVDGSSMTYTNMTDADLSFVRWTLMRYLREIEETVSTILPRTQQARFNLDAILRPATPVRYAAHKTALDAGWLSVNDVRRIEGLPPVPGGDTLKTSPTQPIPASQEQDA